MSRGGRSIRARRSTGTAWSRGRGRSSLIGPARAPAMCGAGVEHSIMTPPTELQRWIGRFEAYLREVISRSVYADREPLRVGAHLCEGSPSLIEAEGFDFEPVEPGWRWGPAWRTCWFRLEGVVPERFDAGTGRSVVLRFSTGTEGLVYLDGKPVHGVDVNRDRVRLEGVSPGKPVSALVEAVCVHPWGASVFDWDTAETRARWTDREPGRLEAAELALLDEGVLRLSRAFGFAISLLKELPERTPRAGELCRALREAVTTLDDTDIASGAGDAAAHIESALSRGASPSATECVAVGHAHIDTAWLWTLEESRRKCLRSFSNVLRLMEADRAFCFLCSQAQHYAWIEEDSPELFAQIAERVREGRWEPGGSMWVEPDTNAPSGESLIRQLQHGVAYWTDRFGEMGGQRHLYLPDTFGFAACLPQIMKLGGLDTFITNKLHWNDTTEFPHTTFRWVGLGGHGVLAHLTPGGDYNSTLSPKELRKGEARAAEQLDSAADLWLQPFGFGDGGGGPTEEMLSNARLAAACEGLPRVRFGTARELCEDLHDHAEAIESAGRALPVWRGELDLEYHRGTLTSQREIKRLNRACEESLRLAEFLAFFGPEPLPQRDAEQLHARLDKLWRTLLLNQFHDILPGSSIAPVNERARADLNEVLQGSEAIIVEHAPRWAAKIGVKDALFCPASLACVLDRDAPPPMSVFAPSDRANPDVVRLDPDALEVENSQVRVVLDDRGRIVEFRNKHDGFDLCSSGPTRFIELFEDRPRTYDAWELEENYIDKQLWTNDRTAKVSIATGKDEASLIFEHTLPCGSTILDTFTLRAGSPIVEIETTVDWKASARVLRVRYPTGIEGASARHGTQFGTIHDEATRNTPRDRARFERCGHRFSELRQTGRVFTLLDDGTIHGRSANGSELGLTLLRASNWPDPDADRGEHVFRTGLWLHDGSAPTTRVAERFARPMQDFLDNSPYRLSGASWAPFSIQAVSVEVASATGLPDGTLRLRLVETEGLEQPCKIEWNIPASKVEGVDLLDRPSPVDRLRHDGAETSFMLKPFQIVTLKVVRG
ncbi:MAG: alpha-mannosidase [Phycisphaerales bacterium]|nr:MAG: alpha-mannosidase [Phycisphaerales bacterium]